MNDLEKHIKNLEEYCEEDNLFEKDGDFKEFCDNHIADIKAIIQELKNTQSDLYEANNRINDLLDTVKHKDKIIAKVMEIKDRPIKDEFITATQGKLNTIIEIESLLEKE